MLITFADFARTKNVSRQAVSKKKLILQPAIVYSNGKQVLQLEKANQCWDGTYKPDVITTKQPSSVAQKLKNDIDKLPDDEIPEFNVSKARREHFEAEFSKIKVQKEKQDLIPAKDAKKSAFAVARSIREALMNTADRLSHQLAGETDATVIHRLITNEHRSALEELSNERLA